MDDEIIEDWVGASSLMSLLFIAGGVYRFFETLDPVVIGYTIVAVASSWVFYGVVLYTQGVLEWVFARLTDP